MKTILVVAQQTVWRELGSNFRGERTQLDPWSVSYGLLLIAVIILCIWGAARAYAKVHSRQFANNPRTLFRQLCAAHRLSRVEQSLLKQLADYHRLGQPASIFLSPECFNLQQLSADLQRNVQRLEELKSRLFSDLQSTA